MADPIPKRDFGLSLSNKEDILPPKLSIVGLGCSSFSKNFWTEEEIEKYRTDEGADQFTADTIQRDHPKVQEWIDTIHHAILKCGINILDTAPWYGHGTSEIVVGWAMQDLFQPRQKDSSDGSSPIVPKILREDLTVNTKVCRYEADPKQQFDFSRDTTIASTKRSLKRLGGDCIGYIDVLQLHDPEFAPTLDIILEETIPAMMECRSKGWCKALGMTGYPLEVQYQVFQHTFQTHGKEAASKIWDQALTYCHFNLHDSSLIHRRIKSSVGFNYVEYESFATYCLKNNIGIFCAAPLSMRLLTNNNTSLPDWHPAKNSELAKACQRAAQICRQNNVDIATLAIVYSLCHPLIPCTILGMKNIEEAERAAAIARRLNVVDWSNPDLSQNTVLEQVLTEPEKVAYKQLNDKEKGPFADLWKEDSSNSKKSSVPPYQWDGVLEAHKFWKAIDGAVYEDWQMQSF